MATFEEIRVLAYKIWEDEGCPEGRAIEHYFKAKEELEKLEHARALELPAAELLPELAAAPAPLELAAPRRTPRRKAR
jgi:hypothetical protein